MKHCAVGVCSSPVHCAEIGHCFSSEPVKLVSNQPLPRTDIVPGRMRCAKCGFVLTRVSLYVNTGQVGAGDNNVEPCPNDGNPMLPVTWEEEAREGYKACEALLERAVQAEKQLADARVDSARLDHLQEMADNGVVSMCFEFDGGYHVTLEGVSAEPIAARNVDSIRAGLDFFLAQRDAAAVPEPDCSLYRADGGAS